jgi:hypothetical protein
MTDFLLLSRKVLFPELLLSFVRDIVRRLSRIYCGVFMTYKNCNIETRSRNYATVDEAVFSPCLAE